MSNNWFKFKQFIIRQDKTAMKVGTDGVMLGAWAEASGCKRILDVGTGTGLIALMLAQRSDAFIDALEINPEAALQAGENVEESPWAGRISVTCVSFQDFCQTAQFPYDLMVCNPPFFSDSLKAKTSSRSLARHNDSLAMDELISGAKSLLNPNGHFCLILPADKEVEMIALAAAYHLFPAKILRIRPIPRKEVKRVLLDFSFFEQEAKESEMIIETGGRHKYSKEYKNLTSEYYLD